MLVDKAIAAMLSVVVRVRTMRNIGVSPLSSQIPLPAAISHPWRSTGRRTIQRSTLIVEVFADRIPVVCHFRRVYLNYP